MIEQLPSIFIGSSTEGLDVAREIELQLLRDAMTTIWKDGVFGLGSGILEALMNALDQFDFAVIILSPDDLVESRGESYASARDNVIFELGLFMGRLGRSRTFIVHEDSASLKLPSDLAGVTRAPYRRRDNLAAALSPTCTLIIKAIRSLGYLEQRTQQQIRAVSREQREQKTIIDQHQEFFDIVKYSLSDYCYRVLWHIANGKEFIYNDRDENLRGRIWFLHDSGYIEPKEPNSYLVFDSRLDRQDLSKICKLTPVGRYLLDLRGSPE